MPRDEDVAGGYEGPGGSYGRDNSNRDSGSKSAATKSKQADLQSFGATPPGSQPSKAEAVALGDAIDRLNSGRSGVDGFFNDFFGIRQEVAVNPASGAWDVKSFKEINPLETVIGFAANSVAGPLGGAAVQGALDLIGFKDPLGFEIDLGFSNPNAGKSKTNDQRDGKESTTKETKTSTVTGDTTQQKSAIDLAVEELLKGDKKFTFFDMPQFNLLNNNFGSANNEINLADLLFSPNQQENG